MNSRACNSGLLFPPKRWGEAISELPPRVRKDGGSKYTPPPLRDLGGSIPPKPVDPPQNQPYPPHLASLTPQNFRLRRFPPKIFHPPHVNLLDPPQMSCFEGESSPHTSKRWGETPHPPISRGDKELWFEIIL